MADPLITDCLTDAARLLGDPSQEQYTTAALTPFFGMAYREMYDLAMNWGLQLSDRETYYNLPAHTRILKPSTAGISDMGEPKEVWERGGVAAATITGITNATPMVVTAVGHGFATNDEITVSGVAGPAGVNDKWFITVLTPDTFSLNGSVAGGAYSSGGVASKSSEDFAQMAPVDTLPQSDIDEQLRYWKWMNDTLYFTGATEIRQLWVIHSVSGAPPSSGSVGIDNSRNFLGARTASLAAGPYNMPRRAEELKFDALGPSGKPDGTGGYLRSLMMPMLKEQQKRPKRPQPFRARRNWSSRQEY